MPCLEFVAIFQAVFRPHFSDSSAVSICLLAAGMSACKAAPSPTSPVFRGNDVAAPVVSVSPSRDTVVDSIGTLHIVVAAHDRSLIDSVAVVLSGAGLAFPAVHPLDTVFTGSFPVPLASLHHQPFSFSVLAGDVLGHDTTTAVVNVRVS